MSTLKNLYISQSYQGLIHLGTNASITGSTGYVELQDGLGSWISASIDKNGNLYVVNDVSSSTITTNNAFVSNDLIVSGNLIVHDNVELKGNVDITGSVRVTQNLFVSGTINAYQVITTVESASVIYSSGSNVIGDEITDTQTIVGQTSISGSLTIRGTQRNTGSLFVSNEISSSTINGIGNVTTYSASVDSRLDFLEGPFSTSVDQRLDSVEFFTSSQEAKNITLASYTGSNDTKWSTLTNVTSSVLFFTASQEAKNISLSNYTSSLIAAFTASGTNVTFNGNINAVNEISSSTLNGVGNVTAFSQSVDLRLDNLEGFSSSFVSTFATQAQLTQTASVLQGNINQKLFTSSFQTYTGSQDSKNTTLALVTSSLFLTTASLNTFTSSINDKFTTLGTQSGSWLTTSGSNNFIGNNTFSGSVRGIVNNLLRVNNTASLDCSLGNFFTITPTNSEIIRINSSNINPGQTISIIFQNPSTTLPTITWDNTFKFAAGAPYQATTLNTTDIVTLVSFSTSSLNAVFTKNLS